MRRILLLSALAFSTPVWAAEKHNLSQIISRAVEQSPEIKEAYFNVDMAKALLDEARAGQYGFVDFLGFGGIHGNAKGNGEKIYGTDGNGNSVEIPGSSYLGTSDKTDDFNGFGPFFKGTLTAVVPIWTWGKLDGYINAATAGVGVKEAEASLKRHEVIKRIKEFFYGYLLASDALDLGNEISGYLEKALKKANELYEKETGEVSLTDIQRLEIGKAELNRQLAEARQGFPLAKSALAAFAKIDKEFVPDPGYLVLETIQYKNLEEVVDVAWLNKPELKQLAMGLTAKKNLVQVQESDLYPTLFAGARFQGGWSEARDTTHNPFLNDDGFGPFGGGPALGVKWNLSFLTTEAKIAQARADLNALKAKGEFAKIGIPLQIEQAYRKVLEFREKADEAKNGATAARRWMVSASNNYDMGIGEPKTLMEGIGAYAMMKVNYYRAVYDHNLALAQLSQLVGKEVTGLNY